AAELDIVAMLLLAVAEHEDELMPRAVERTHAAVALDPDAEVQKIEGHGAAGGEHLAHMPPVHAGIDDGAGVGVGAHEIERRAEEARELLLCHLAGGHREFAMLDRA